MQFYFIILDLNELQTPQLQHGVTTDQLGRPRLPLYGILLSVTDEQRLSPDMDRLFRQVQKVSTVV